MEPVGCVLHIKFPLSSELLFVVIVLVHFPAQFTVIGPHDPVTAILGQEAVLPCHLSPRMSAANMEVRWFRSEYLSIVHLYRAKDQYDGQMPQYQGRTELLKAGLTDGNVSLRILNIRRSDEGQYHCFVQDDTFYEETVLELRVAGHLQALFFPIITTVTPSTFILEKIFVRKVRPVGDVTSSFYSFFNMAGIPLFQARFPAQFVEKYRYQNGVQYHVI
uniref:Ig-like domain-containing protein n=1 Tax=Chrysemys picta bellii TaxID=8478 RepID=A0A8C3FLW8_CHRPI